MDPHDQIAARIIQAQESIVGPIAFEQAKKVKGLKLGSTDTEVRLEGDKKAILDQLVRQYETLFGRASIEVCKNAIRSIANTIPKDQLPPLLVS
jgi:hypothetical protein